MMFTFIFLRPIHLEYFLTPIPRPAGHDRLGNLTQESPTIGWIEPTRSIILDGLLLLNRSLMRKMRMKDVDTSHIPPILTSSCVAKKRSGWTDAHKYDIEMVL